MTPQGFLTRWLVCSLLLHGTAAYSGGMPPHDPCRGVLPNSLEKVVKEQNQDWLIISLEMLDPYHSKLFVNDYPGKCPGIAKVDLYGDGRQVYAIVLTRGTGIDTKSKLILAQETGSDKWQVITLDDGTTGPIPVVVGLPAGTYEHVYRERTLSSNHEVIAYIGYESWAVVYAWNGKAIEEIQVTD